MTTSAELPVATAPLTPEQLVDLGVPSSLAGDAAALSHEDIGQVLSVAHCTLVGGGLEQLGFERGLNCLMDAAEAPAESNTVTGAWHRAVRVAAVVRMADALGLQVIRPEEA